jgi:hypothetical protein
MQTARKLLGWGFGIVSVILSIGSVVDLRWTLIRRHGTLSPRSIMAFCFSVSFALIFGMAWWTTWKTKPSARNWGIASSLAILLIPVFVMHFTHQPMTDSNWSEIAVGALSLIAYAWPDRERESPFDHQLGADDSAHE